MAVPSSDQALATLDDGQRALERLFDRLSDEQLTRPATIGGDWSAKDLLGHLAFWEELAVQALADWRAGRRPDAEAIAAAGQEGVDAANARNQARTAGQSIEEVRARAGGAHRALMEALRELSDHEWRSSAPFPNPRRATLAEQLGSILGGIDGPFRHASEHLPDLRAYVELAGPG